MRERLEASCAKHHANAHSTAEARPELIALAREIREMRSRGKEAPRVIAHELDEAVRRRAAVNSVRREPIRAVTRVTIRQFLRKKGYPLSARLQAVPIVIL